MKAILLVALACFPLAACATTSFAPPEVLTQEKAAGQYGARCAPGRLASRVNIDQNVTGAIDLTDNFVLAYRCAERELANGRRTFEIPAILAAVAGLAGPSFGLSSRGVLATGVGAGILNSGNSYFAPKAKAALVDSALRAVLCIKTESVGISYFPTDNPADGPKKLEEQRNRLNLMSTLQSERDRLDARLAGLAASSAKGLNVDPDLEAVALERQHVDEAYHQLLITMAATPTGSVEIGAERQYFEMVSGALFSVESILSSRLRDAGSVDTTDTFAKMKQLVADQKAAQDKLDAKKSLLLAGHFVEPDGLLKLENEALHPKLQTCVLQARS